jgi:chromosomal replication initiation ATPase DnaA
MRATAMGDESQRAAANAYQMEVQSKCAGDPIVYVDDIGRADGTETFREGIYDLVRALEERRAVCVLTSNLTEKGILSNLRDDVSSRLFNREWITRIEVDPQDIRPTLEPRETQEAFA